MQICEIETPDKIGLNEASLNRIWQHVNRDEPPTWAILTSWRSDDDIQTNKASFIELTQKIRTMDLGFIKLAGYGQEEDEAGNVQSVKEPSLFIPNITYKDAKKLMKLYNQFGIIYSGPEVKNKIMLVMQSGRVEDLGNFSPHKISQFYSIVKGKPFVFEGIDTSCL
jgi:hypothetical protein